MNRFYVPEHCSTQLRVLGITFQLRWINAGTISKEVELRYIHVISRFITEMYVGGNENGYSSTRGDMRTDGEVVETSSDAPPVSFTPLKPLGGGVSVPPVTWGVTNQRISGRERIVR